VVGENATPEKELEIPDAPDEPQYPDVEQLSFGMIEPEVIKKVKVENTKIGKATPTAKGKTRIAVPKSKDTKVEQALLISKGTSTGEKIQAGKTRKSKTPRSSSAKPVKTPSKPKQSELINKKTASTDTNLPVKRGRPKKTGNPPVGNSTVVVKTKKIPEKSPKPSIDKNKPAPKAQQGKQSMNKATGTQKTPTRGTKPVTSTKNVTRKTKAPVANSSKLTTTKSSTTKPKTTTSRTPKQPRKPGLRKTGGRKPPQKKMTVKSAITPSVVLVPPTWKPKRSKNSPKKRKVPPSGPKPE
jgi:hypothetical protein